MRSIPVQIKEFREVYGLPSAVPTNDLAVKVAKDCLWEETQELTYELVAEDYPHNTAKECIDVVYTIAGLFAVMGWDFDAAFEEVHRSNMSKLGKDGKPIYKNGKVMKGPNYSPADLRRALGESL